MLCFRHYYLNLFHGYEPYLEYYLGLTKADMDPKLLDI